MRSLLLSFSIAVLAAAPAAASSSPWQESEGGAIRIVTAGAPDEAGTLRGALEIALKPGWKTYWKDPGDTGIPPSVDVSQSTNVERVEVGFPAPEHVDDGTSVWAGYHRPIALPLTFTLAAPGDATLIEADVFLGICEAICIPVQGRLTVDPGAAPRDPGDAALVEAAFAALPEEPRPGFRPGQARVEGDRLVVTAEVPEGTRDADLFIASGEGYLLGAPSAVGREAGIVSFEARLYDAPQGATKAALDYTLVADGEAVSGKLELP